MKKKHLFGVFVFMGLFFVVAGYLYHASAATDDFPKGPVRYIVPYSPGGSADTAARILQPFLEKELKVPVLVENRPGAGGEVGATYLHNEPADGYKFMAHWMPDVAFIIIRGNPLFKYDDLDPIVVTHYEYVVLLVKKDSPLNSFNDFVEEAKKNPGKMSLSVTQQAVPHVLAIYLKKHLNIDFKIVPFKGGGDAVTAALGGHVSGNWGDGIGRLPYREQMKAIAVSTKQPHSAWPEGKPIHDQLKQYGVSIPEPFNYYYRVLYVRTELKKKYPERYEKLRQALLNVSKDKEYIESEKKLQLDLVRMWKPGDEFEKDLKGQYDFFMKNKDLYKEE